jgi:hypothetical protein
MNEQEAAGWRRVYVEAMARSKDMGVSLTTFYRLTKVSEPTYKKMRDGIPLQKEYKRRDLTDGAGWTPDSIDRILAGGAPVLADPAGEQDRKLEAEVQDLRGEVAAIRAEVRQLRALIEAELRPGRPAQ